MSRHARTATWTLSRVFPVAIGVVLVLLLTAAAITFAREGGREDSTVAGAEDEVAAAAISAPEADGDCRDLRVVTASTYAPVLEALAGPLGQGEDCLRLATTVADGRRALETIADVQAHVWIPDDVSWVSGADPALVGPPPESPTVVAATPIHVLAGDDAAAGLGADGVTWAELATLAEADGSPVFVAREPSSSGEGLLASGAIGDTVWAAEGMDAASGTLSGVFERTRPVDDVIGSVGAGEIGLVAESTLLAHGGVPTGTVLLTPTDRSAVLRHTWVATTVDAGDAAADAGRARLLAALTGPQAVDALASAGLRAADMAPPAGADWLPDAAPPPLEVLGKHHVEHVFAAWYEDERAADHLIVIDVSESMWAIPEGADRELLENVKAGVVGVADELPDTARMGVWEFGSSLDGERDHRVVADMAELTPQARADLVAAVGEMRPLETGTGLHDTILAAYLAAQAAHRPEARSQVLVFTDGRDEADPGSLTAEQLGAQLAAAADPARPVSLAVVVFGDAARDVAPSLGEQLKPVRGYVSTARTTDDVVNVFAHVAAGGLHG